MAARPSSCLFRRGVFTGRMPVRLHPNRCRPTTRRPSPSLPRMPSRLHGSPVRIRPRRHGHAERLVAQRVEQSPPPGGVRRGDLVVASPGDSMSDVSDGHATGPGPCALCLRSVHALTRHHLIPRCRRDARRRRADPEAERATIDLCRPCHDHLHAMIPARELERSCATLASLAAHPAVAAFTVWVAKRPDGANISAAAKKRR